VPAPTVGDAAKYLRGDGAWSSPPAAAAGAADQLQFNLGGLLSASSTLVWDHTAANLGVGTSAPKERLHADGNVRLGQAPAALTLLNGGIDAVVTTLTVDSTTGYPSSGTLLVDAEAMSYTGTTATTFTGVSRAALGTAAAVHADNTPVNVYLQTDVATSVTPRMVVTGDGKVGIGTAAPGAELDVKGALRLSGATSGFVGLSAATAAGSTTYTLPAAPDAGKLLSTDAAGLLSWILPTTTNVAEGANQYFTAARAKAAAVSDGAITNGVTDVAPSQNQVFDNLALKQSLSEKNANNGYVGLNGSGVIDPAYLPFNGLTYSGVWRADTNAPALTSGVCGVSGTYYIVSNGGATNLDGNNVWALGDWVICGGSGAWQRVGNASSGVTTLNGQTGATITLTTGDIGESGNLYFTTARARTAAVADAIVNGTVDVAPSQNAVFDALALKQDVDADLSAIAALAPAADAFIAGNGAAFTTVTGAAARTALGLGSMALQAAGAVAITGGSISGITDLAVADGGTGASTAANARTNLGLAIGTDVQAYSAALGSIAALTTAADKMIYTTAANTYAVTDLTAAGRALLDDANATAQRSTLGLGGAATLNVGTAAGTVAAGDDSRFAAAVVGPASATDNAVVRYDGTTGKLVQNSTNVVIDDTGKLGVGTASPTATLDVNGAIKSATVSNAGASIDFATGNLQYTTAACGSIALNNMKSGASYTLGVQGAAGGTCAFTAYSGSGTGALTVKAGSVGLTQTAGKHALFTFLVMGSYVYVASIDGY
jgi:hypothetical protein